MGATIQTGLKKNTKNYKNFCYWLNGVDVTDQNLDQFTPFIKGVARIFMIKTPPFLANTYSAETENFKSLIESGFTRIDGIQDTNVEFVDFEGGYNGQKFRNVSLASNDTDTITITVYEQTGSPLREYLDLWVTGVRDIKSGIAHYHGAYDVDTSIPYSERNHTAEFIYCVMDPSGRQLEYACMFAHAFPTKVPKSHLNYESRDRGNVPMDIEFAVQMYESPAINAVAAYCLQNSMIEYNYLNFTPNITGSGKTLGSAEDRNVTSTINSYSTKNTIGTNTSDANFVNAANQVQAKTGNSDSYGKATLDYTNGTSNYPPYVNS